MQVVKAKMGDFTGTKTGQLKSLPISSDKALHVKQGDVSSVRTIISQLHKKTLYRFITGKVGEGINVWRLPDAVQSETINQQ
ncbi:hypothetical protein [Mucilaginibacter sp.]|uniref:hypothetical protein n=1 Tax=Mucilaginibacter sp. TaxID=1882438 RepID=UPI003267F49D